MTARSGWKRFAEGFVEVEGCGLTLDLSAAAPRAQLLRGRVRLIERALREMRELEAGVIANPAEGRRVGHYWLRAPELAPDPETAKQAREGRDAALALAARLRRPAGGKPSPPAFDRFLHIGIGGSVLGPQLIHRALAVPGGGMAASFMDNTDPEGMARLLAGTAADLERTLVIVVSKSGGTRETLNGLAETRAVLAARGVPLPPRAIAITGEGSSLDRMAREEGWLARLPLPDWVGGRTSVTSAAGILPAALAGLDAPALLDGARRMDEATRRPDPHANPAALLALAWHLLSGGRGRRNMVILPYADRLELLGRYLRQLVMESLGKEKDRDGRVVHQGLTVFGHKGSTDQHSYMQQIRDGRDDAFVTFLQVLEEGGAGGASARPLEVEPGLTSGDYLAGFLFGTRQALAESGRPSLTIALDRLDQATLGALIALFERTVGLYASLIGVNAYDQPGVEAGKRAAGQFVALQRRLVAWLDEHSGPFTAREIAQGAGAPESAEMAFHILRRLAANPGRGIGMERGQGTILEARFSRRAR